MLLSVLLQATAAAVGVSKLGAAIGAGLTTLHHLDDDGEAVFRQYHEHNPE